MKRRTRANIGNGQWPNMRADTLKQISDELTRARKKHPAPGKHVMLLNSCAADVITEFTEYANDRGSATRIYASSAAVAAMAIRIMEEGSSGSKYRGNTQAPDFKLTTVENDRAD